MLRPQFVKELEEIIENVTKRSKNPQATKATLKLFLKMIKW